MLLPEGGVDFKVGGPKSLLGIAGRIFEVGDRQVFAGDAVPGGSISRYHWLTLGESYSWRRAASSAHAAPPSAHLCSSRSIAFARLRIISPVHPVVA